MLKIILFFTIFITALSSNELSTKVYDFKSGVLNFNVTGNEKGTITVYTKEYGNYLVIYTNLEKNFINKKRETIKYITPKWVYEIDLQNGIGSKYYNKNFSLNQKFKSLTYQQQDLIFDKYKKCIEKNRDNYIPTSKEVNLFGFHSKTKLLQIDKLAINSNIFDIPKNIKFITNSKKNQTLKTKANSCIKSLL